MDWINLYAIAVSEENAAGGRIVTAPTNGAAGIVPAVLNYATKFCVSPYPDSVHRFLLTAGEMSYAFEIQEGCRPIHLYWGAGLARDDDLPDAADLQWHRHYSDRQQGASLQEYPAFFGEYYHECAI